MPLAALGMGEIRILGSEGVKDQFLGVPLGNTPIAKGIGQVLNQVNPNVKILTLPVTLETRVAQAALEGSHILVDATNDPRSKSLGLEWAEKHACPFLSVSATEEKGKLVLWQPGKALEATYMMPSFEGQTQSPLMALLLGGLAAEEIKKIALGEKALAEPLYYQCNGKSRFEYNAMGPNTHLGRETFSERSVLAIGAGALGNIMALALAEMGVGRVVYVDYDRIESTNLNRQVLFYDGVGEEKAEVLARKHRQVNPRAKTEGLLRKLEVKGGHFSIEDQGPFDAALDMMDDRYARAVFAAYALLNDQPLITAASSPVGGKAAIYIPGKTSCFDHVFGDYYKKGLEAEAAKRISCIQQPDPSVIMTNQVAAALAALELAVFFSGGESPSGVLKYDTNADARLGFLASTEDCDCQAHKERVPDMELK